MKRIVCCFMVILLLSAYASAEWLLDDNEATGETTYAKGSTIVFGHYEQDNDEENGKEDIEWIVLANNGEQTTLISKEALDCVSFDNAHMISTVVTWDNCELRKWLNNDFLIDAFTPSEQNELISTTVTADRNPDYMGNPGNNTYDKVYLLSIDEANTYFGDINGLFCNASDYAIGKGAAVYNGNCSWWLRTPGSKVFKTSLVSIYIDTEGVEATNPRIAVRPVITLKNK